NQTQFTGPISGQGGFTITSSSLATNAAFPGAVVFSGPNTFSGGIVVVGGQNGFRASGVPATLGIGSGATTVIDSTGQLISGPFGTGQLSFFNTPLDNQGNLYITGTKFQGVQTYLQTPDD